MVGSKGKRARTVNGQPALATWENALVTLCDLQGLCSQETLILKGLGQTVRELGSDCDEASFPGLVLWSLGMVMDQTVAEIDRKLLAAQARLRVAKVPETLDAMKRRAAPMPAAAMVAEE
jgi:hypothetical protein